MLKTYLLLLLALCLFTISSASPFKKLKKLKFKGKSRPCRQADDSDSWAEIREPDSEDDFTGGQPDCTCVPVLECGATLRAEIDESEENICGTDDEVCCPNKTPEENPKPSDETPVSEENPEPSEETPFEPEEPPTSPEWGTCGVAKPLDNIESTVIATEENARYAELPWTVLLMSTSEDTERNGVGKYRCAGTLVHKQAVLTAAHCVSKIDTFSLIVRAGEWDLGSNRAEPHPEQDRNVQTVIIHPDYTAGKVSNNIALIILSDPFDNADNINTVCLPRSIEDVDTDRCFAAGWGVNTAGKDQQLLKKIELPIIPRKQCQKALRTTRLGNYFTLPRNLICAGGEGKDVCEGDGGGPLVCPSKATGAMTLIGVTSWGVGCGQPGVPGVFSDVTAYNSWISDSLNSV